MKKYLENHAQQVSFTCLYKSIASYYIVKYLPMIWKS